MNNLANSTLGEDLRYGNWGKGTVAVITSLISIVVLPLTLVFIMEGIIDGMGVGDEFSGMLDSFTGMIWRFAIYGLPVVALAFFKKSYVKGSKARLLFNLISLGYSVLWIYIIFEGGALTMSLDLSSLISGDDIPLENIDIVLMIQGLVLIIIGLTLFRMLLAFTSYGSNRDKYLLKFNEFRADREYVPSVNTTFGQDLKRGSVGKGLASALFKSFLYLIIPYLLIEYSDMILDYLSVNAYAEFTFEWMLEIFERVILYGIPLVVLGFFTKFYEQGNKAWTVFRVISLIYFAVFILLISEMGGYLYPISFGTLLEYNGYVITSDDVQFFTIIVIVVYTLLKAVVALLSHGGKRRRYLRKLEESDGN